MATISNTPRPGYVWDSADNVWYPIGVGAHQHTNAADTPAVIPYSTYAAAGKNKILNGDFGIWQRGTSFNNNGGTYSADRFIITGSGTAPTITQQTFTPGTAPVSGYEAQYYLRWDQSSAATAAQTFQQRIEDVRTLAGQTITISFWAKANSGSAAPDLKIGQSFGSGGSSGVTTNVQSSITFTGSWVRYSYSVSVPSISGKTIGAGSYLQVYLQFPTSGTWQHDYWGFQLEAGSTATAFQTATGNPASELAACQRYYYRNLVGSTNFGFFGWGIGQSSTASLWAIQNPVTMRTTPTVIEFANLGFAQVGSITAITTLVHSNSSPSTSFLQSDGSATANTIYRLMANNSSSAYLGIGAEL
jgi:hypothetical protein